MVGIARKWGTLSVFAGSAEVPKPQRCNSEQSSSTVVQFGLLTVYTIVTTTAMAETAIPLLPTNPVSTVQPTGKNLSCIPYSGLPGD